MREHADHREQAADQRRDLAHAARGELVAVVAEEEGAPRFVRQNVLELSHRGNGAARDAARDIEYGDEVVTR